MPLLPLLSSSLLLMLVLAGLCALPASIARAAPFSITGSSTAAQVAGAGSVAAGASLTVGGPVPAVTMAGRNATFTNLGTLDQTGSGHAILLERGTGATIRNGSRTHATATIEAVDSDAIHAKEGVASVNLDNFGAVMSHKLSAKGGQAVDFTDVAGANSIHNHAGASLRALDADAVRPGANGVVVNAGKIVAVKRDSSKNIAAIDGQFKSGIRVTNASGGLIDGGRHGITGGSKQNPAPFTMQVTNAAGAIIRGNDGAGLNFDGLGAGQVITVVNHGSILGLGVSGDGDGIDVDGLVDITNTGVIRSVNAVSPPGRGMAFSEGISAGGGTIVNAGTIEGLVADGNTNAVGRAISLVGNDIEHGPPGAREGIYGNALVVNQRGGVIRSIDASAIVAAGKPNAFTITIDNAAGATIVGGGADAAAVLALSNRTSIVNAGTIDGAASGKAVAFGHAGNTLVIKGGSAVIQGAIDGGPGGGNAMVVDAGADGQFTYAGDIARFDTLDVRSGHARLSGQLGFSKRTVLSGGRLTLLGPHPIAPGSALVLAGGVLNVAHTGPAGQTFASLSLEGNTVIEAGRAVLSFERIGTIRPGKRLTLSGPLRIVGKRGRDTNFQALLRATRIGDAPVAARFDGRYTHLAAAPVRPRSRERLARVYRATRSG